MAAFPSPSAPPNTSGLAMTAAPPSSAVPTDSSSSSRLLHVYHSGMIHRKIRILGPDKATVLYTVDLNSGGLFSSKPHLIVWKADTDTVVGMATFHSFSRTVDMVVHNKSIPFPSSGALTSSHEWTSLAGTVGGGGQRMHFKWKMGGFLHGGDMRCSDQEDRVFAKFESSGWALTKDGKFEVAPSISGALMDEIIVSGLAMLELRRRRRNNAAGGAAASNAASGAAVAC